MANSTKRIQDSLNRIGLFNYRNHYSDFITEGLQRLKRAGAAGGFACDTSCLKTDSPTLIDPCVCLVIDIGGSHTRVAMVERAAQGAQRWYSILDYDNTHFDRPGGQMPIERFAAALADCIATEGLPHRQALGAVDAVGIIWSNALTCFRLDSTSTLQGVSGRISGIEVGRSYRKEEFFIKALGDGYDLGNLFIAKLSEIGIAPRVLLIGNDTIFTLKATPGASAGMVASTGANATDINDDGFIINTEMGGLYELPHYMLSLGDAVLASNRSGDKTVKLEDLIAGKWLPLIFFGHLSALKEAGEECFSALLKQVHETDSEVLSGRELSLLLEGGQLPNRLAEFEKITPELRAVAAALIERAGSLAGSMAYFALYHELARKPSVVLSLDSTMARHLPGYLSAMQKALERLVPNEAVKIVLQSPDGDISVPMRGLVEALAAELAQTF